MFCNRSITGIAIYYYINNLNNRKPVAAADCSPTAQCNIYRLYFTRYY